MSLPEGCAALKKAFTGILGVDENAMLEILVQWSPEHLKAFRKETYFFSEDEFLFERWANYHIEILVKEFLRFQDAVVQWTMHPWERDARLAKKALDNRPQSYGLLIELACTRTSEEFLGARKAYQSLYDASIEEDVASQVTGIECKFLVALVSSYRYEGSRAVNDGVSRAEAEKLGKAIRNGDKKKSIEDEEIIRILTTRSKLHLKTISKHYKDIYGKNIDEDLNEEPSLKDTINCLCAPPIYFSKILDSALKARVEENEREALTRVIVTRTNIDMKDIAEQYNTQYGAPLTTNIEAVALGNYKDFLIKLVQKAG